MIFQPNHSIGLATCGFGQTGLNASYGMFGSGVFKSNIFDSNKQLFNAFRNFNKQSSHANVTPMMNDANYGKITLSSMNILG